MDYPLPAQMRSSEIDAEIGIAEFEDSDRADALLTERSRRIEYNQGLLRALESTIVNAYIFHGVDIFLTLDNPTYTVGLNIDGVNWVWPFEKTADELAIFIKLQIRKLKASGTRFIRLTPTQSYVIGDELERCDDNEAYGRLVLNGNKLTGAHGDMLELADGIEAVSDIGALTQLAEDAANAPLSDVSEGTYDARVAFALRSIKKSRTVLLKLLRSTKGMA